MGAAELALGAGAANGDPLSPTPGTWLQLVSTSPGETVHSFVIGAPYNRSAAKNSSTDIHLKHDTWPVYID
ncbi:hypothetical protein UY3_18282 [Chelonia mydas]|uniref:Uncharacterized protein n=1 Tax=Chelonia mydas TaxID=8469 RepID=M7B8S6_CHEMY|nr:hypothetical protein UY3_18282 [Chelonia mydas]